MPTKKLVELNGEYGGWMEIDQTKVKRLASNFKEWLLKVDPNNDPFDFINKDLPLVNSALNGTLKTPFNDSPHNWEIREGLLPRDYLKAASPFYNAVAGALLAPPQVIKKNGRYYAWTEFEDPE